MRKTGLRGFQNRAVQPQKMARGLKFRILEEERLYYPCSENKGADQLRGYRKADLRLCFRICKKPVFSRRGSCIVQPRKLTAMEWLNHAFVILKCKKADFQIQQCII